MSSRRILTVSLTAAAALAGVAAAAWFTRPVWGAWFRPAEANADEHGPAPAAAAPESVNLSPQAAANLNVPEVLLMPEPFRRTVSVPGSVVERPALTGRAVAAPLESVVVAVHIRPGQTIQPGQKLFTLRPVGNTVRTAQGDLYKAMTDITVNRERRKLMRSGVTAEATLLDNELQYTRLLTEAEAIRRSLLAQGLSDPQVKAAERGELATEIEITAPSGGEAPTLAEVKDLPALAGQRVPAGGALAVLADRSVLWVEGRAFKNEVARVREALEKRLEVEVEFPGDDPRGWPEFKPKGVVHSIGAEEDPESRTVPFYVRLTNQSRPYDAASSAGGGNGSFLAWRFRPGQRARLHVPVEEKGTDAEGWDDVFVLPVGAVARDGVDAYVFRVNGDLFDRKPVHVLYQDHRRAVVANDGSILPGVYVAGANAATLNRILKTKTGTAAPPGFHIHPDGSVHANHH